MRYQRQGSAGRGHLAVSRVRDRVAGVPLPRPGTTAIRRDIPLDSSMLGLLVSSFCLCSAIAAGVGGRLAVGVATTTVVRAGVLASSALSLPVALTPSLWPRVCPSLLRSMSSAVSSTASGRLR